MSDGLPNILHTLAGHSSARSYTISGGSTIQLRSKGIEGCVLLEVRLVDGRETDQGGPQFELLWHRRLDWTEKYKGKLVTIKWLLGFMAANEELAARLTASEESERKAEARVNASPVESALPQSRPTDEQREQVSQIESEARERERCALADRNEKALAENLSNGLQYADEIEESDQFGLGLQRNRFWDSPHYVTEVYGGYRDKR